MLSTDLTDQNEIIFILEEVHERLPWGGDGLMDRGEVFDEPFLLVLIVTGAGNRDQNEGSGTSTTVDIDNTILDHYQTL
jgi:hypothetical protein